MSSNKPGPKERDHRAETKARGPSYWTSRRDGEVHLRQEDAFASQAPVTVHDMVMNTAIKYANYIALGSKHRTGWHLLTYIEYYEECRRAAKAFLKLGLERFHSVGIMGLNSEEWVIASIGAIMAGGFSVGILSTNSPKTCQVIAESSEMDIFVVDNDRQLQKIIQIQGYLKHLKAIVQYKEEIRTRLQNLYSWRGFLDLADGVSEDTLNQVIDSQKPNQCCALLYSMSIAGPPKPVMLSHDNITWTTETAAQTLSCKCPPEEQEVLVSYLPLSYLTAQLFDVWVSISVAGALYFAQPDALRVPRERTRTCRFPAAQTGKLYGRRKFRCRAFTRHKNSCPPGTLERPFHDVKAISALGLASATPVLAGRKAGSGGRGGTCLAWYRFHSPAFRVHVSVVVSLREPFPVTRKEGSLIDTLREVKPTMFYGVPWVWDRLLDSLKTSQLASTPFRRRLDKWAMCLGLRTNKRRMLGLAKRLTFSQARRFLGLQRCRQYFNLGTGLSGATTEYFLSLNMPICELYGLSESTGVHTLSRQEGFRLLSCGKSLPSTRTKTQREDGDGIGDIHIWGRNIFMGYLDDEEKTQEKIDLHGWLRTGDLGFLDDDEFLYVTGNERDLITLSSGEKINPNPIEERVKRHIPLVRYVVLVGQDAPYLCALLTLKCQINTDTGEPRNALTSEAVAFCRQLRSQSTRLSDIVRDRDPLVTEFISQGIDAANAEVTSNSAKIVKWTILETDFSVAGGELGATAKLKRANVGKMYQPEIESFYSEKDEY
ncbi:long-chain-fatty-acid--CoA ligase ACSBG2-like isoform X2 [Felis catus]|uniref:long-chain-fatty-acid--CoA ligase ACSBG2-like isoform X2 n=1 Tax=Felis catus TaxID=9685 RepID=UPI001D19E9F7|nr:long-chain-fatty-acid--CoA ligase ACSBG2-like isoform X2 [Felis catus]